MEFLLVIGSVFVCMRSVTTLTDDFWFTARKFVSFSFVLRFSLYCDSRVTLLHDECRNFITDFHFFCLNVCFAGVPREGS